MVALKNSVLELFRCYDLLGLAVVALNYPGRLEVPSGFVWRSLAAYSVALFGPGMEFCSRSSGPMYGVLQLWLLCTGKELHC